MSNRGGAGCGATLVLVLAATAARGQDGPTVAYRAIQNDAQRRQDDSHKAFVAAVPKGEPPPDARRMEYIGKVYRIEADKALRLVELVEASPNASIALDALIEAAWQVNTTPWPVELVGRDEARSRAFAILERDHLRNDRLGPLCERVSNGFAAEYERFLRRVLADSPHASIRAAACLGLGHLLHNRRERLDLLEQQPALAAEFAGLFGEAYLQELRRWDRTRDLAEAEALLERADREFGTVKLSDGATVAERARSELFGIRALTVGKVAPEIEGPDQDGVRFKLSDYRGKVVLLDFWSEY